MVVFDWRRKDEDLACMRHEHEALPGCVDVGEWPERLAEATDLDAQAGAMGFVDESCAESAREEHVARNVLGPRFTQRTRQSEQYGASGEGNDGARVADQVTTGVDDEGFGLEHAFDFFEEEEFLPAASNETGGGGVQGSERGFDFGAQGGNGGMVRSLASPAKRGARDFGLQAADGNSGNDEFVDGAQRGREEGGIAIGETAFGIIEAADEEKAADFQIAGVSGVEKIPVLFERGPRRIESFRRPAQVAGCERNFNFGDDAPGAGDSFTGAEGTRGAAEQFPRPREIAELRHGNASKGEGGRIVAQRNALQCAEGITGGQRARCCCD